jgi:hypothetical protein
MSQLLPVMCYTLYLGHMRVQAVISQHGCPYGYPGILVYLASMYCKVAVSYVCMHLKIVLVVTSTCTNQVPRFNSLIIECDWDC